MSYLSAGPLLSACCDGLLIIFQFCTVIFLWMLLTGSGDEFCGPLLALFQAVAYYPPAVTLLPFQSLFTEVHMEINSLPLPSSLVHFQLPTPLLCVSFQFLIYCSAFFGFFL
jgi:hypothetical protein